MRLPAAAVLSTCAIPGEVRFGARKSMKRLLEAVLRWLGYKEPIVPGPAWRRDYERGCE